jgi:putative redox protein
MKPITVTTTDTLRVDVTNGEQSMCIDEPVDVGGEGKGLKPTETVLAALGACSAITLKLYAGRKEWPLEGVRVTVTAEEPEKGNKDAPWRFVQTLELEGDLDEEQRARLVQIAGKCPVHRMLEGNLAFEEREASAGPDA